MRIEYYLHDDYSRFELAEWFMEKGLDEEVARKAADERPFYEVTLVCDVDEVTGKVTLVSASL